MAGLIGNATPGWGIQLPIQSQSLIFRQDWEPAAGPLQLAAIAKAADQCGALYVAVCDHIAIPADKATTMGGIWYDTVATLSWLAAQTKQVHLLSHVLVVPYRHPLVVAKQFSTLDLLSGGRAILGVGVGHVEGEFEILGAEFHTRGADLSRGLEVIRTVFRDGALDGAVVEPKSPRPDGPPIWVGGSSEPALRRAATLGDGWLPQGPPDMGMRRAIAFIAELRDEHELADPFDVGVVTEPFYIGKAPFEVAAGTFQGSPQECAERLQKYVGLGISQCQVRFAARDADELINQIDQFGSEVWPLVVG
jgi:probable F420-dependent oxidoreductase